MVVFGTGAYLASAHTSSVHPFATGTQTISSGPGVYAQTTSEYAASWTWTQLSASYDYYWYLFTSGGTLTASGHKASGGNGGWSGVADVYYLKEYNNEASGSGHINVLQVNYCC
jgi:hypothetical protein